jgi:hypothetical protein
MRIGGVIMDFRPPSRKDLPDPKENFAAFAEEYVLRIRAFYDSRARWHRKFYRASGILVIVAGASLPVLATTQYPHKDFIVSCVGAAVAAVTALRAFYRWDQGWVLLRQTEFAIDDAYSEWKGSLTHPANQNDAKELLMKIIEIRRGEAASFFKDMTFPTNQ